MVENLNRELSKNAKANSQSNYKVGHIERMC